MRFLSGAKRNRADVRTKIDSVVVQLGKAAQRLTGGCAYYLEELLEVRNEVSDLCSVAGKGADSNDGKRYRANGVDEGEGLGVGLLPLRLKILDPDVWGRSGKVSASSQRPSRLPRSLL